ncbi:hypothetical protein V1504DRAFT_455834 [Lipomyces starkeyi]
MTTHGKRLDYRAPNNGMDDEAASEDRIARSTMPGPDDEILHSESASQLLELRASSTIAETPPFKQYIPSRWPTQATTATEWLWAYFETTTVDKECIDRQEDKEEEVDK